MSGSDWVQEHGVKFTTTKEEHERRMKVPKALWRGNIIPSDGSFVPTEDPLLIFQYTPRPTDVLIATGGKQGTTWMQYLLYCMKNGLEDQFDNIFAEIPWLDCGVAFQETICPRLKFSSVDEKSAWMESCPDPRIFKTHLAYPQLQMAHEAQSIINVVLSIRDPRDTFVSFYHHRRDMSDSQRIYFGLPTGPELDLDLVFGQWMDRRTWWAHTLSWWSARRAPGVLILRYEDMLADLKNALVRIREHLHWEAVVSDQRLEQIASSNGRIAHMKVIASKFKGDLFRNANALIRSGVAGEGKRRLSPEQNDAVLTRCRQLLPRDLFEWVMPTETWDPT